MRFLKKLNAALALALTLTLISPVALPAAPTATVEAATIKINKTKKTLKVGQTYQLKITGTKKKVTWKSSKKTVATVTSKGKVKAKAVGKTNITATVGKKKFTCKITVKDADNKALATAPFNAKEVTAQGYSFVAPKDWISKTTTENGTYAYATVPTQQHVSHIAVAIQESDTNSLDYASIKEVLSAQYTEETVYASLTSQGYENLTISNFKTSDVETQLGTAFCLYYEANATVQEQPLNIIEYDYFIFVDDSFILINGIDIPAEGVTNPSTLEAVDYIVQSIMKK